MPSPLRLIADDLTGALDSAAALLPAFGPVAVSWAEGVPEPGLNAAISTESRDAPAPEARRRVLQAARSLFSEGLAFKKLDSMLRGHPGVEIAACLESAAFDNVIVAPAFPAQLRWTRGGLQHWIAADGRHQTASADIGKALASLGWKAETVARGGQPGRGISICDAESDEDLDAIVHHGLGLPGRTLWCGTAGLAAALGRDGGDRPPEPPPRGTLGLIGTVHAVSRRQLARLNAHDPSTLLEIEDDSPAVIEATARCANGRLASSQDVVIAFNLPHGRDAAQRVSRAIGPLVAGIMRPAAVFVSGGETCRILCDSLGCTGLDVRGIWLPGIPRAVMQQGRWDGLTVYSKSGAFGSPETLVEFLRSQRTVA